MVIYDLIEYVLSNNLLKYFTNLKLDKWFTITDKFSKFIKFLNYNFMKKDGILDNYILCLTVLTVFYLLFNLRLIKTF